MGAFGTLLKFHCNLRGFLFASLAVADLTRPLCMFLLSPRPPSATPQMAPGIRSMPPVFTPPQVKPLQPGELPEVNSSDVTEADEAQPAEQSMVMEPDASAANVGNVNAEATQAPAATAVATQTEGESPRHSGGTGVSYAHVGVNTEDEGNDDVQEQTGPAEEEEAEQETIAESDREEGAAQYVEKEKDLASDSASALLKEENVRLATELAEARARLEKLELEAQARAEAVAGASAAAVASSVKKLEAFKNVAAIPQRSPGGAEEAVPLAKDEATTGAGVQHVAEAEVEASPTTGETVLEAEGDDVVTAMRGRERSGHKGRSTGAIGGEEKGRSVSDIVGGPGWDSAKPAPEKRGPSRAATQKQLVAYRTGLSMLVKLCNQLTAASSVTAGLERGGASRTDPETIPVASSAPEGTLSRATPVESRSRETSVGTSSLTVTGEPGLDATPGPGAVPSAGAANVATVAEPTGSPVAFEDSRPLTTVAGGDNTTGTVEGEAEGRDTVTSVANRVPGATELEQPPREVAMAVTTVAGVETPSVEASSKAATTEGRLAPAAGGGGTGTVGADEEGEKTTAAPAPQGEAASVAQQKPSSAETSSGDRTVGTETGDGGGSDAGSKQIVAARSTSKGVDKIKRAAEHVAAHIRRSHVSQVRVCFPGCICLENNSFAPIHRNAYGIAHNRVTQPCYSIFMCYSCVSSLSMGD